MTAKFVPGGGPALPDDQSTIDWLVAQVTYLLVTVANLLLGFPFITQADWYVDPTTGNDTNSGAAGSPLQSLPELARRINGRILSPSISQMTINLAVGTYTQPLFVETSLPLLTQSLVIRGTMVPVYSGTIQVYTAWNAAGGVRAAITDPGANFAASLSSRIRMTSGAANNGLSAYNSVAAATICQPNSFAYSDPTSATSASTLTPANGDTFVVETQGTVLAQGAFVRVGGSGKTVVRDMNYTPSSSGTRFFASGGGGATRCIVLGVQFGATASAAPLVTGCATFVACYCTGNFNPSMIAQEPCVLQALSFFGTGVGAMQGYWLGNNIMHDPNGAGAGQLQIINGAHLEDIGSQAGHCFFNCVGGTSLAELNDGGEWHMTTASCLFWGSAGNTATVALKVFNGSGFVAVTRPTATGAVPGNDYVLAGGAPAAWATWPAIAAAPNNAYACSRV